MEKFTLTAFSAKTAGASHKETGKPCQDAVRARLNKAKTIGLVFASDGHGGEKYIRSDKGSCLAVEAAEKSVAEFYGKIAKEKSAFFIRKLEPEQRKKEIEVKLKQLEANIIYSWRNSVKEDIARNPLNAAEKELCAAHNVDCSNKDDLVVLYGATLLAALVTKDFWFALQLGDGICVTLDTEGSARAAIQDDPALGFGRTSSLCESNAVDNFRHAYGFEPINGITAATDGVADSFEREKYFAFIEGLYEKFTTEPEKAAADLEDFLPELSERGSRDDCAIAGVFRVQNIQLERSDKVLC